MTRFCTLCALFVALLGCVGVSYNDSVNPVHLKGGNAGESTRVLAKAEEWRNSGAIVEKGKKYSIKAHGRWKASATCNWTGPDGAGAYNLLCFSMGLEPLPTYTASTLIAKIGDTGSPFGVGNELLLTAQESGVLYFRINDIPGWCFDNEGYVDVDVALAGESQSGATAMKEPESRPGAEPARPHKIGSTVSTFSPQPITSEPEEPSAVASSPAGSVPAAVNRPGEGSERRIALVIGNSNYKTNRLANPVNDATDIAKTLTQLGFDVDLLTDADQRKMDEAIRRFGNRLGAGPERRISRNGGEPGRESKTVGLFFFAGHGVQVSGENYFIPIGANMETEEDVKYAAVPAGKVLDTMGNTNGAVNIVLIDACRDNPFARGWRSSEHGLAAMQAASGMLIGYATAPGRTASDGQGRNSPYTKNLLKYMMTPGLPIEAVFKNVRTEVYSETNGKQVPWESISIIGDFFFNQ